jgi:plasmid stabilization system protein ParE
MTFDVRFSVEADDDLVRLFDFLVERAKTAEDLESAVVALDAVRGAVLNQLSVTPFCFRKAGKSSTRRELVIPAGATGYVALYEVVDPSNVLVLAVRHQREEDYH